MAMATATAMAKKTVAICGGGNAAHVLVAELGSRPEEYDVVLFAPFQDEAARFRAGQEAVGGVESNLRGERRVGKAKVVAKDAESTIPLADIVLLPIPSIAHRGLMAAMAPYLKKGSLVIAMPGQGCFDQVAVAALGGAEAAAERGITVAGTNQLPYQCRINDYGKSVELIGHKATIGIGVKPASEAPAVAAELTKLLRICEVTPLPHFLSVTLTPGNQLIHPSIMWGLFNSWQKGDVITEAPLFYQNCDEATADTMDSMSIELCAVAAAVERQAGTGPLEVPRVDDMMRLFYGPELLDPSCTRTIFATNKGYAGLTAPMKTREGFKDQLEPNFGYRYLTEDIPNGLCVCKGVAELAGVPTPTLDRIVSWAQAHMGKEYVSAPSDEGVCRLSGKDVGETQAPQAFGVKSLAQLAQ